MSTPFKLNFPVMLRKMWSGQEVQTWLESLPPLYTLEELTEPTKADERQFKDRFIANYLSTWTVIHYDEACFNGEHERLNHPPVEDAIFLANKAWEEYQRLK